MTKEMLKGLIAAMNKEASANFSAENVNEAAVNAIMEKCGITKDSGSRAFRAVEAQAFALIEEAMDEILPAKISAVLNEFAETKTFARDAEVVFDIEKIGKRRAKLTIAKGARGGIYRAARLDNKYFSLAVQTETVGVYVSLEDIILGTMSLSELYNNVLEGFEEIIYKEVFNALATGVAVAGSKYQRIAIDGPGVDSIDNNVVKTTKEALGLAIDDVMPYVKQYGVPTIFGSYAALQNIYNPLAATPGYPNLVDSQEVREYGFVQVYKGHRCVELPNYLVDNNNKDFFYEEKYVFVIPSGAKPVKVALKGELLLQINKDAVGSEKWEAHKLIGVGLAMANNYAVIEIADLND